MCCKLFGKRHYTLIKRGLLSAVVWTRCGMRAIPLKSPHHRLNLSSAPFSHLQAPSFYIWKTRAGLAGFLWWYIFAHGKAKRHCWASQGSESEGAGLNRHLSVCPFANSLSLFSTEVHFYKEEGSSKELREGLEASQETWRVSIFLKRQWWSLRLGGRQHDSKDSAPPPSIHDLHQILRLLAIGLAM